MKLFFDTFIEFVREIYGQKSIALHRPVFNGNEKQYLLDCIESNYVSSVGEKVTEFEYAVQKFTGSKFAIAMVNGTAALHVSLKLVGVLPEEEVISQALTFIATCNAISYCGAIPVFVDVDRDTMGMSPVALHNFLNKFAEMRNGSAWNKFSGKRIAACVPMHTFGLPCRIEEIAAICQKWGIPLIEDAAESLGSYVGNSHTGRFGIFGTLSFNGNKIITTGGGGMIITDDENLAKRAKHITTTSKLNHPYEFEHDEIGFNYRLPNLNAALGCAQMENLGKFLDIKADIFKKYYEFFRDKNIELAQPIQGATSNYWLNAVIFDSKRERDQFLEYTNKEGIMTRPIWKLMTHLPMFKDCQNDGLVNSLWLEDRVVNIPSSVPDN
jgi:aminotransferase in exopolysaccharide biosynthesis